MSGCTSIFNTLGAGAPSKGTKEELSYSDHEMPLSLIAAGKRVGVKHVSCMTAVGANANSVEKWYAPGPGAAGGFYSSVKGKLENDIKELKFESTAIFQPSTIIGTVHTPAWVAFLAPKLRFIIPEDFWDMEVQHIAEGMVKQGEEAIKMLDEGKKGEVLTFKGAGLRKWGNDSV